MTAGVILTPENAYRFARGEEVVSSNGMPVKLSRPLDWLVVTDHSDAMRAMNEIVAGNPVKMNKVLYCVHLKRNLGNTLLIFNFLI